MKKTASFPAVWMLSAFAAVAAVAASAAAAPDAAPRFVLAAPPEPEMRFAYDCLYKLGPLTIPAGSAEIAVARSGGRVTARVSISGSERVEAVRHFKAEARSVMTDAFLPLTFSKAVEDGDRRRATSVRRTYLPGGGCEVTVAKRKDGGSKTVETFKCDGVADDFASLLFLPRRLGAEAFAVGAKTQLEVVSGRTSKKAVMTCTGAAEIAGRNAVAFSVVSEDGDEGRFAFADDADRTPLVFEVPMNGGRIVATLRMTRDE